MVRTMSIIGHPNFRKVQERQDKKELKEGILVFTNESTLEHKKRDGFKPGYCYWVTAKIPKKFIEYINWSKSPRKPFDELEWDLMQDFPIYIAIKGIVRGYFIVHLIDFAEEDEHKYELQFYSDSFKEVKHGEKLKPSQGWRYYPKVEAKKK